MVMQVMRHGRFSGVIKFGFLSLLVLGTMGLVLSDVGGVFTGNPSGNNLASVGGEKISLTSFDRMLGRTLPRLGISPQEAYQLGYMQQLLNGELRSYALQIAAKETGIEVSRDQIALQVAKIVEPVAGAKGNKQEILDQILRSQGMTEPEFVGQVGREAASGLLSNALSGAVAEPSKEMLEDLYLYENETRDIELIAFPNAEYKLEKEPGEAELKTAYEGLKENFAIPESRDIEIMIIDDTALKASIDVTEEEIRKIYDEDKNAFVTQEIRKVEQAILKDASKAQDIAKLAQSGKTLKEAVKEATGDEKAYLGEIDFEKTATQESLRAVVFEGKETGKVLGPVETPLGHHVMIVKKIMPAAMKSFESVKDQIKKEQMDIKSSEQVFEVSATLDDLLASGTAIEEIKKEVPLKITSLKAMRQTGQDVAGKDLLVDFKDDASNIVQTSFGLLEGETSPVTELADGRYAAIHANAITPKSYKPYEEVAAQLKEQTIASDKAAQNRISVKVLQERLSNGEVTLSSLSEELKKPIKALPGLKKNVEAPEPLIAATLGLIFAGKEKQAFLIDIKDGVAIAVITKTSLPKASSIDPKVLDELKTKLVAQEKNEALEVYVGMKMDDYGISINEGLLKQFYGAKSQDDTTYDDTAGGLF